MSDNVRRLKSVSDTLSTGGDPPDNGDMDVRLAKLEAIIPTLATKEDLMKLRGETKEGFSDVRTSIGTVRTDMHENSAGIIKWMVGIAIGLGGAAITVGSFVLNNAIPKTPPATQSSPVTINMPGVPAAPASKP